jgi:hypothetical protein
VQAVEHVVRRSSIVLLAACAAVLALSSLAAPARAGGPPYPPELVLESEVRVKADLIHEHLAQPVQLVFFGGSRSQRFDPEFARRATGLRAVNIAISNAHPEIVWAMLNWFYAVWPEAKIRCVLGMQSGMLRDRDLDPALIQDPRFYPYFPDDLLREQRALLPASAARMPKSYGFLHNRYSDLGMLLWNVYDRRIKLGLTLDRALDEYIARVLRSGTGNPDSTYDTRARAYFEKTVALLNDHGVTPIIVLMPVHPRVLTVMRVHHMGGERQRLRNYLAAYGRTAQIKVLDFTDIRSFNGNADWFYDGVHITRSNANRVILAVKRRAGGLLK